MMLHKNTFIKIRYIYEHEKNYLQWDLNSGMKRETKVGICVGYKITLFLQWQIAKTKYIILNF